MEYVQLGMMLAKTVYSAGGNVLLGKGVTLNQADLAQLAFLGIQSIYVEDPLAHGIEVPDVLSDTTRNVAITSLRIAYESLDKGQCLSYHLVEKIADEVVQEVEQRSPSAVVNLTDVRANQDYTYAHCVNVATFAVLAGTSMGIKGQELRELTVGALLHDIGKVRVHPHILNKPDKLTEDEFSEVKKHSFSGFEILCDIPDLPTHCKEIAFQHHERFDGTGYPRQLSGERIHRFARITAVADVYDALVADRPYRRGFAPHQAVEIIHKGLGTHFDPEVGHGFLTKVAQYPPGTVVELSTGDKGVVAQVAANKPNQPIVRLFPRDQAQTKEAEVSIALEDFPQVAINRVMSEPEITELRKNIGKYTFHHTDS